MRRLLLLGCLVAAGCGIKGAPKPPVQVVPPPAAEAPDTPPRPDREATGTPESDRGPFPPAAPAEEGAETTVPATLDGGDPLIPGDASPVPDAPPLEPDAITSPDAKAVRDAGVAPDAGTARDAGSR